MRVTNNNIKDYQAIESCKYQKTFPVMNVDALDVLCIHGVDIEGLAPYQYAPLCQDCVGKGCKNYQSRV